MLLFVPESHDVTQPDKTIKIEHPEVDCTRMEVSDVNIGMEDMGLKRSLVKSEPYIIKSEPDIEYAGSNIGTELKDLKRLDYETQVQESYIKSEFDDVKLEGEEVIIKDEDEIDHTK